MHAALPRDRFLFDAGSSHSQLSADEPAANHMSVMWPRVQQGRHANGSIWGRYGHGGQPCLLIPPLVHISLLYISNRSRPSKNLNILSLFSQASVFTLQLMPLLIAIPPATVRSSVMMLVHPAISRERDTGTYLSHIVGLKNMNF